MNAAKRLAPRTVSRLVADWNLVTAALWDIGAMREPEIAAASGLTEDRVHAV